MKFLGLFVLLFFALKSFSQSELTKTGINSIIQAIDSIKDTSSFTFYEGDTLKVGEVGYRDVFYTYRIGNKTNDVLYIRVWRKTSELNHEFYFQNGNLIKAIIAKDSFGPETTFYLWDNTFISQEPTMTLFWKAFNQIGYYAHTVVKRHFYGKISSR
jgi:antitoxin component YwqK of YwqJK toxin-antitoxin module